MRVAYISNHPAPYRDAFLSSLVRKSGLTVDVFSLFPNDSGHAFWDLQTPDYQAQVLAQYCESRWKLLFRLLKRLVFTRKYDFVFWPGLFCFYLKIPLLICAAMGRKYAFSADTVVQLPIGRIAFLIKRYIVRSAAFIFVPGEASMRYFHETFGIAREKIITGAYALDGRDLEGKIESYRLARAETRKQIGLGPSDIVFLMVANMIKTRHYPVTGAAFIQFAKECPGAKFVMVGRGPEFEPMRCLAEKHPCLKVVAGCSFDEMLRLYAASDVYVHGGTEPASTALIIGAIARLPLLSSPAVGCYHDVVRDGESGLSVENYLSVEDWRRAFVRIMSLRDRWWEMGLNGRELSKCLDVDLVVEVFAAKLKRALA